MSDERWTICVSFTGLMGLLIDGAIDLDDLDESTTLYCFGCTRSRVFVPERNGIDRELSEIFGDDVERGLELLNGLSSKLLVAEGLGKIYWRSEDLLATTSYLELHNLMAANGIVPSPIIAPNPDNGIKFSRVEWLFELHRLPYRLITNRIVEPANV